MIKKLIALFSFVTLLLIQTPAPLTIYGVYQDYARETYLSTPYDTLTYADVFEDGQLVTNGDFNNGTTGWSAGNQTIVVTNGKLVSTTQSSSNKTIISNVQLSASKYFYHIESKLSNIGSTYHRLYFGSELIKLIENNTNTNVSSGIYTLATNQTLFQYIWYPTEIGHTTTLDNIYVINLTSLFGAGAEPTQAQMDEWFETYQDLELQTEYYNLGIDSVPYDDINLDGFDDNSFLAGINQYMSDSLIKPLLYSPLNYTFMIGFFIYLILLFLSFTFKNRIVFAVAGLFYFVPLSIFITDIWISLLSVIAIILHMTFAFFHNTDKEETI